MLTTSLPLAQKYDYLAEKFRRAYEFLQTADLAALPLGRVEIDGDALYASVQEYTTHPAAERRFEAHDRYFDIQYVVSGEEWFGYAPRETLEPSTAYDPNKDMIYFCDPAVSGGVVLRAGDCAIVAPEDAHKPCCTASAPCQVRKIVVKVRV